MGGVTLITLYTKMMIIEYFLYIYIYIYKYILIKYSEDFIYLMDMYMYIHVYIHVYVLLKSNHELFNSFLL
jgi:hypothetical protein